MKADTGASERALRMTGWTILGLALAIGACFALSNGWAMLLWFAWLVFAAGWLIVKN